MRPIDADKLREEWVNHLHIPNPDSYFAVEQEISSECIGDFIQSIDEQPTVEIIKHGHWVLDKYDNACCSNCHQDYSGKDSYYKVSFCAYCGAKMDEEVKNESNL